MKTRTVLPLAALVLFAAAPLRADDPPPRTAVPKVTLEYKRDPAARKGREDASSQQAPDVPDDLKVVVKAAPAVSAARRPAPRPTADAEGLGAQAGETMAQEAAREWGWRQYWRAGFQHGSGEALQDPRAATWDRAEGFRYGRLDPRALTMGGEIARDAAADAAAGVAAARVRAQFTDLSREPRHNPSSPGSGPVQSRYLSEGSWAEAPVFDDVFTAMPLSSMSWLNRDARSALDGWNVQPATLSRAGGSRAYDGAWKDSGYAFSVWRDRQRPGSYWSRFGPGERDRFRAAFLESFEDAFASIDLRPVYAGYRVGYADGWRYGIAVNAEWAYRQGYAAGFDDGVRAAAALSFPFLFDKAYAAAYEREFQSWSTHPMPALEGLHVVDGNDDGIIEPGERVMLAGDVVNYGGAPGTADVRVAGSVLDAGMTAGVRFAARGRSTLPHLDLRIAGNIPARTQADLDVSVAGEQAKVPVYVSWPLELAGEPVVDADPLGGKVRIVLAIANRSRNALEAETSIAHLDGAAGQERRDRLQIPAGGSVRTEAVYEGLRPLDVMAGTPQWAASVRRDGTVNDERTIRLAPPATDLANPDLLTYMLDLAHTKSPAPRDVADARTLLLLRMRADWQRSVAMDGNPYKTDYEEGSASTALGELVRAVAGIHGGFASRDVFAGTGSDIAALADDLPGAHPLLRKWMKRLAKRVG